MQLEDLGSSANSCKCDMPVLETTCQACLLGADGNPKPWLWLQESGAGAAEVHELFYESGGAGRPPPSSFDFFARLLVPLYAARAAEEALYGREGQTLSTAPEVGRGSRCFHMARPLCAARCCRGGPFGREGQALLIAYEVWAHASMVICSMRMLHVA